MLMFRIPMFIVSPAVPDRDIYTALTTHTTDDTGMYVSA